MLLSNPASGTVKGVSIMLEHGFALELNGARKRRGRAAVVEKKFLNCGAFFSFFPSTLKKEEKMRAEDTLERSDLFLTLKKAAKKCAPKIGRAFFCLTEDCL